MGYSLCSAMALGGIVVYFIISPFLFINILDFQPKSYGWFSLFIDGGVLIGGIFNGIMLRRLGRHSLLRVGALIMFLGGAVMLVLALFDLLGMWVVMLPMALCCMGIAMTFANSFAGAFHPFEKMAGYAAALFGFIQILGSALISAIISTIIVYDQFPLAIALTAIGALAFVMQSIAFKASLQRKLHDDSA